MPMREDCVHYESRMYDDDGEVARFCTLGLAPEAPWRCPEGCPRYERLTMLTGDMNAGSLGHTPPVEDEPDKPADAVVDVLAYAEAIVDAAAPAAIAEVERTARPPVGRDGVAAVPTMATTSASAVVDAVGPGPYQRYGRTSAVKLMNEPCDSGAISR